MNIAVLVSGEGTTLQHLIDYSRTNPDVFQIKSVGADRICNSIHRALKANIPLIDWKEVYSQDVDFICLAGFLRKVNIQMGWNKRVINIHPALLPGFGGEGMYGMNVHKAVHKSGVWYTGCTIHLCDNRYDHGPIIYQESIPMDPDWSADDISTEVQKIEKEAYIKVLKAISDLHKEGVSFPYIFEQDRLRRKLNE